MDEQDRDTFGRFERRFRAIEAEIPERWVRPPSRRPTSRFAPLVGVAAALVVVVGAAIVVVPRPSLIGPPSESIGAPGATSTPAPTPVASPQRRTIQTGDLAWFAACADVTDADCDGAVALFANNLARSQSFVHTQSGGLLHVFPRPCPTYRGLTARLCWDITVVVADGPKCMLVAHDANDDRYGPYFQFGGHDWTGRFTPPGRPSGQPRCLGFDDPSTRVATPSHG
jgi:hypothetical protein